MYLNIIGFVVVKVNVVIDNDVLFVGYLENGKNEMNIILGQYRFSLQELFSSYEYDDGDNWFPFGVEE